MDMILEFKSFKIRLKLLKYGLRKFSIKNGLVNVNTDVIIEKYKSDIDFGIINGHFIIYDIWEINKFPKKVNGSIAINGEVSYSIGRKTYHFKSDYTIGEVFKLDGI